MTILNETKAIRLAFWRGEVTEEQAKEQLAPHYQAYREHAKAVAKAAGMKASYLSLDKFLRQRTDLRWDAQERQHDQRHEEQKP